MSISRQKDHDEVEVKKKHDNYKTLLHVLFNNVINNRKKELNNLFNDNYVYDANEIIIKRTSLNSIQPQVSR